MKKIIQHSLRLLLLLLAVSTISGCRKNAGPLPDYSRVETYVALLKANQYDSLYLPAFSYADIPALLTYRNETQLISVFPKNPISSYWQRDCKLGIYVLWTIESIRAVSIKSKLLILRFPSQNSILALRNATSMVLVADNKSQEVAAEAYFNWWENNRRRSFEDFAMADPLIGTDYKWH